MIAGQTSVGANGLQNALFPLPVMFITQLAGGGFSHEGTYAIDFGGRDVNGNRVYRMPYYAPFDCVLRRKTNDNAGVEWTTLNPVNTPSGVKELTLVAYHDNDVPNMSVGTVRRQGEFLGRTGTAGNVTGDHVHFEMFLKGQEWVRPSGMIKLENSLYVNSTVILYGGGMDWKETSDSVISITPICGNRYLNMEEMTNNAQYIAYWLGSRNWSPNAIAGILGNMQTESTINPCIWESLTVDFSRGFGLVQWTPASKYIDWATQNGLAYNDMDSNLLRIIWEIENNQQWIATSQYPMSFKDFTQSSLSPEYLADVFIKNYERPLNPNQPIRGEQARHWFEVLDFDSGNWDGGGGITSGDGDLVMLYLSGVLPW